MAHSFSGDPPLGYFTPQEVLKGVDFRPKALAQYLLGLRVEGREKSTAAITISKKGL
jgi:hypothetical protein